MSFCPFACLCLSLLGCRLGINLNCIQSTVASAAHSRCISVQSGRSPVQRHVTAEMADCCQVIDGNGSFQEDNLVDFIATHGVVDARTKYQVVAIMGPQSSGKSTLMNHVVRGKTWQCNDRYAEQLQNLFNVCLWVYCSLAPAFKRWMP